MYATEPAAVQAMLQTAAVHCRAGGMVAVLPDFVRETFAPGTDHGGHDAADGRGLRSIDPFGREIFVANPEGHSC